MRRIDYMEGAEKGMAQIKEGVFLTVKSPDALNTMTVGWTTIGYCWRKPIMMVAVRRSRHTFNIIEEAADFTVSIPSSDMRNEIAFCGSKSGRDYDKFKECALTLAPSQKVSSPIIDTPGIHYECRIVYKSAMDPLFLDEKYERTIYSDKDYHTLYFGEILDCYVID